jgi:hypothetical protein
VPKEPHWKAITPGPLQPAIKHVRDSFERAAFWWRHETQKSCYGALHPVAPDQTAPAIFKWHLDECLRGLTLQVRRAFDDILHVALPHSQELPDAPVEWTKSQLLLLINVQSALVRRWIKDVCDKQDVLEATESDENSEEWLFWRKWRAPKLIHMEPCGNTPYDSSTAWSREDKLQTEKLLESLSKRFIVFLEFELDGVVGNAHVRLAQGTSESVPAAAEAARRKQPLRAARQPRAPRVLDRKKELIARLKATQPGISARDICFLMDRRICREPPALRVSLEPLLDWQQKAGGKRTWVDLFDDERTYNRVRSFVNKVPPLRTRGSSK